jgi:exonuclease III
MECPIYAPSWENGRNCRWVEEYNIQITALQEMRQSHDGWIEKKNYTLLHNELKTSKRQHGTGFLITRCATQRILDIEPINERMCKLRIKGKFYNMTIISVYAPTEHENKWNAGDVEQFCNKLSDVTKHQEIMPWFS